MLETMSKRQCQRDKVNGDNVKTLLKAVKKGRYQNFPVLSSFA